MNRQIRIATCQHAVSGDVNKNFSAIKKHIINAKSQKADIVHFSESNLSGYAGLDFIRFKEYDEEFLQANLREVIALAKEYKLWLIIGSHHYEKGQTKPYNCLYLINDKGIIVDRYDKRLLYTAELPFYTAGKKPVIFNLKGISCGLLICHEWRYPEVYRNYKNSGVDIIFQSWYDGNLSDGQYEKEGKELGRLIVGTVKGNAANNYLWISASNTSKRESTFPAMVVRPDGKIESKLYRNRSGVLITDIDLKRKFADPSGHLRKVLGTL